jgi:HSP20 family protein
MKGEIPMAEARNTERQGERTRTERGALERTGQQSREMTRWDPFDFSLGPFSMLRRMQEDMERLFQGFGTGRRGWMSSSGQEADWMPAIEAFQRGNEFVVRADVPGLSKDDLTVEIGEDALTIQGERKHEEEEEREGVYRSERSYGRFYRVIPLPEGAVPDSAKAQFKDGVLDVVLQAPSQEVRRGRKVEIESGSQKSEGR